VIRVRVWDLPTRVFHWSLVLCFLGLLVSGQIGGDAMEWHFAMGYGVLTLLLFRLVWGFAGGHWSRFAVFVVGPSAVWRYIRGAAGSHGSVGHNPLGSLSVLALLGFALLQVATGLFSDDEIANSGPFAKWASGNLVAFASYYHSKVGKVILIVLVQLHIAAILFYRIRRGENLVLPMINGDKQLPEPSKAARDDMFSRLWALATLSLCGLVVWGMVRWAG
jgi:cytochrome b